MGFLMGTPVSLDAAPRAALVIPPVVPPVSRVTAPNALLMPPPIPLVNPLRPLANCETLSWLAAASTPPANCLAASNVCPDFKPVRLPVLAC